MSDSMKKSLESISAREECCTRLNAMSRDEIIAMAKELGFEVSEADFQQPEEQSGDELGAVAGGARCVCSFGGDENKDGTVRCICSFGGHGQW